MIKNIIRKALKPKGKMDKLNAELRKARRLKGIKGAKEEFRLKDEKKASRKKGGCLKEKNSN